MDINHLTLLGRLTRDPDLTHTSKDTAIVNFSIAVNRYFKSGGEQKQEVSFVDCKMFGPRAEVFAEHLAKGRRVLIVGRLSQEKWQDKDGNNRSKMVVVAENFDFVDARQQEPQAAGA